MSNRSPARRPGGTLTFRTRTDLLLSLVASVLMFTVALRMRLFDRFLYLSQGHLKWEVGDVFSAFVVLALTLGVFAVRRSTELARAVRHQKRVVHALRASERRFAATFRNSPHAQLVVSLREGEVLDANVAFAELTLADPAEILRRQLSALEIWESPKFVQSLPRLIRRTGILHNFETTLRTTTGETREVLVSAVVIEMGGSRSILMGFNDISARKRAERQLTYQAFHDALTGLPNRALFHNRVAHAIARAERRPVQPAVLFLDLDGFKWINDAFGHQVGDELLRQAGDRLLACLRESDTCARLGGDEFGVLIDDAADHGALVRAAEGMLQAVGSRYDLPGIDTCTTVSIGIARAEQGTDVDTLLRNADLAMYMAKGAGKGRFAVYEEAMHDAAVAQVDHSFIHGPRSGRSEPPLAAAAFGLGRTPGLQAAAGGIEAAAVPAGEVPPSPTVLLRLPVGPSRQRPGSQAHAALVA